MFGLFRKKKAADADTEIIPVPAEERRIYIFDFDRTITILHTGGLAYGNECTPAYILSNIKKGFSDFVRRVMNYGHIVYITSYSDDANAGTVEEEALSGHDLIKFYMDQAFGEEQTIFTVPRKDEAGETITAGNIIAVNTQDYKQHHLDIVLQQEGLDRENPFDMKKIYLLEDDEEVVRYFMEKGCTILVPFSASRSADTAATKTLFTAYMPESFIA